MLVLALVLACGKPAGDDTAAAGPQIDVAAEGLTDVLDATPSPDYDAVYFTAGDSLYTVAPPAAAAARSSAGNEPTKLTDGFQQPSPATRASIPGVSPSTVR